MSKDSTTHATLLARLSAGADPAAWREFCERYGELIRAVARRHNLQPADCDDALQDVLLALTQSMPGFRYDPGKGMFRGYLKTVVLHAVYRRLRQNQGAALLETLESAPEPAADAAADEAWESEWRQHHLRHAMHVIAAEFNDADRAAFDAYVLGRRDARETAQSLGLTVDQVYQAKSRILRRLSELIERQISEEG